MDDEEAEKKLQEERLKKGIPLVPGLHAGCCGKCGAPYYQDTFTGALRPLCCCWNLPKITYGDHT